MSEPEDDNGETSGVPADHRTPRGVNLAMIYTLMGLALLAAMALAALIVLPYYQHRH